MIILDSEAQDAVINEDFDLAIPFNLTLRQGESEPEIKVFPMLSAFAEEFIKTFGDSEESLLSPEAIDFAIANVSPFLEEHGFELVSDDSYFIDYTLDRVEKDYILPETLRLTEVGELENLTEYDIDTMAEYGHICFATVVDRKIVAVACTNYPCDPSDDESDMVEIGVETAEDYQRKGLGSSCCAALTAYLLENNIKVLYECESDNLPSRKLIERLSGKLFAKSFCVVGQKLS